MLFSSAIFSKNQNSKLVIICAILLCLYYVLVQPFGLAISPDSTSYLQVAKSLLKGEGFYSKTGEFVKHWPPIYSILIALTAKLTWTNTIQAGFILNGLALITAYVFGFKILRLVKLNQILCFSIPFVMVISKAFFIMAFMLSESVFLALELITLFYYIKWLQTNNFKTLIGFSLLCSLLFITRYAAAGIIGGFLVFELFLNKKNKLQAIKNCFIIGTISCIGIITWLIYVKLKTDATEVRHIGVHILSFSKFIGIFKCLGLIFINKSALIISVYLLFIGSLIFNFKALKTNFITLKSKVNNYNRYFILFIILSSIYIVFVMISMSFFDRETPTSSRIFGLIFPFIIFGLAILLQYLIDFKLKKMAYFGLVVLAIGILSNSVSLWKDHYFKGHLYSSKDWRSSEIASLLNNTNQFKTYSNAPDFLNFKTKTLHYYLPFKVTKFDNINTNYNSELNSLKQKLTDKTHLAIYFYAINRSSTTPKSILKEELKQFPITYFKDGFVIGHISKP